MVCSDYNASSAFKMPSAPGLMLLGETWLQRMVPSPSRTNNARWLFPWEVNARLPGITGGMYGRLVAEYRDLPDDAFAERVQSFRRLDADAADACVAEGGDPYRIRYNDFMAVRSKAGAEDGD